MKETKITKNTDENPDIVSNVTHIAYDNDLTDPRLPQLGEATPDPNVPYSLDRLEIDLKRLQSKWRSVEQEITDRDEHIALLEGDIEVSHTKVATLEAEVAEITAAKEALTEQLDSALVQAAALEAKNEEIKRHLDERTLELETARESNEDMLEKKRQLEADLAAQRDSSTANLDRVDQLESENVELRVHIQELQDYIDGRKSDWDNMKESLRDYENTIKGMTVSLGSHDKLIEEKESEKSALAARVIELERELAELAGRQSERESAHAELQQTLEEKSRELGGLNSEAIRLRKDIDKLKKKLDRRDETVRSLKERVKQHKEDDSSLEKLLESEKATNAELAVKLDAADKRIADLEAVKKERETSSDELGVTIGELRERLRLSESKIEERQTRFDELDARVHAHEQTERELREQLADVVEKLDDSNTKANEYEIRAAELNAVLLETRSDKENVERELEAQRELVEELERELHRKQENLDLLDRSAERLSAISSGIRDLDDKIEDHRNQQPSQAVERHDKLHDYTDEVLIQPEELFGGAEESSEHIIVSIDEGINRPIRHRLHRGVTTIGRSRQNDIRLNNKYISRVHARITVDGDHATIEDAGSKNGFLVNSEQTTRHTLSHGDRLEIGTSKLKYLNRPAD